MSTPTKMILSTIFFSLMQVCVKLLNNLSIYQIIFVRSFIILFICILLMNKKKINPWGNKPTILVLRGLSGSIALILFFYTLQRIPLASAITIQYLSPIFTVLLAGIFLKEKASIIQWSFLLLAFVGIFCIQGFDNRVLLIDSLLGISSAFMAATAYNFIRVLKEEHSLVVVFYFPLVSLFLFTPHAMINWKTPSFFEWTCLIFAGIFTYIAQFLMTQVYQKEKASNVVHYKYLGAAFSLFLGYVIFDEHIIIMTLVGISIVVFAAISSTLYTSSRKHKRC